MSSYFLHFWVRAKSVQIGLPHKVLIKYYQVLQLNKLFLFILFLSHSRYLVGFSPLSIRSIFYNHHPVSRLKGKVVFPFLFIKGVYSRNSLIVSLQGKMPIYFLKNNSLFWKIIY